MDPELNVEAHQEQSFDLADLIRVALVALVATATWFRLWQPLPRLDVIAIAGLLVGGKPDRRVPDDASVHDFDDGPAGRARGRFVAPPC